MNADPQTIEPILVNATGAARLLSVSRSKFYQMNSAGLVPMPIYLGGCARWSIEEIRGYVRAGCPGREQWNAINGERR
jgi:predicted DNA-binding transcriptional regulator AlpA